MILSCRSCGSHDIKNVLSLGFTPLANALLTQEQLKDPEEKFPLDLVFCQECTLLQIIETVPPEKLFSKYFYNSSISKTTLENAKSLADKMMARMDLTKTNHVVEIGSNDGYLLKNYAEKGVWVLGYEPAQNIAEEANKNGIRTFNMFFNSENADKLVRGDYVDRRQADYKDFRFIADAVHANNVLAHVADLHSVVEGIKKLLGPDSVAIVETHYAGDLISGVEFDCVYHEHLCYYSMHSLKKLFEFHGMTLVDVEHLPIHGGSLRAYFQLADGNLTMKEDSQQRVAEGLNFEIQSGLTWFDKYKDFGRQVESIKKELMQALRLIKKDGKKIVVYGASAKSTTLLNYFGIDSKFIDYVVDDTPGKQGMFTPGTHLPIYSADKILETMPDFVLILTWNFADEIMAKNEEYKKRGGFFIIPIPKVRVV